jgi:hypothetical protein
MYHHYRRVASFSCLAAFLLFAASNAFAHVNSGGNCASSNCHGDDTGRMTVSGNTGMLSVNPRLDLGNTAQLPLFTVTQGKTVPLTINVINSGTPGLDPTDKFGVALTGTLKSSVLESLTPTTVKGIQTATTDLLNFIPDSSWTTTTKTTKYFYQGAFDATGSTSSKTYNLGVNLDTKPDVYSLTLRATGNDANFGMWTQSQEVLVQVLPVPEPSTIVMMLAAGGFALVVWRRKK